MGRSRVWRIGLRRGSAIGRRPIESCAPIQVRAGHSNRWWARIEAARVVDLLKSRQKPNAVVLKVLDHLDGLLGRARAKANLAVPRRERPRSADTKVGGVFHVQLAEQACWVSPPVYICNHLAETRPIFHPSFAVDRLSGRKRTGESLSFEPLALEIGLQPGFGPADLELLLKTLSQSGLPFCVGRTRGNTGKQRGRGNCDPVPISCCENHRHGKHHK